MDTLVTPLAFNDVSSDFGVAVSDRETVNRQLMRVVGGYRGSNRAMTDV